MKKCGECKYYGDDYNCPFWYSFPYKDEVACKAYEPIERQLEDEEDKQEQPKSQLSELVTRLLEPCEEEPYDSVISLSSSEWDFWSEEHITLGDLRRAVKEGKEAL